MKRTYPIQWKKAKIVPIPKPSDDFRPIVILPFISKVFESIIHKQISQFITENVILHFSQSGFRKGHSCITALADVTEDIRKEVDDNKITFLILLDHSKAFDSLNHDILCMKLSKFYNFLAFAVDLIESFLEERCQAVY